MSKEGAPLKEIFDLNSQDIFIFLSPEQLCKLEESRDMGFVDKKNRVAIFLSRIPKSVEEQFPPIQVTLTPSYPTGNPEEAYTNISINLGSVVIEDLKNMKEYRDRYPGATGGEKINLFLSEPERETGIAAVYY